MNYERMAADLLVALRGSRSQVAWSRRLGYQSNVAYAWESGRRWPTAAETLRAAGRAGVDVRHSLRVFHGRSAPSAAGAEVASAVGARDLDPASPAGVARLLDELRGTQSVVDLARRAKLSRCKVSRWLGGRTEPRLPDFLRVVEAASLRSVDLLASLVDPEALPSVAPTWRRLEARRKGAHEVPWAQAVLRALELADYRALPAHEPGWIARRLGISREEEQRCLDFLAVSGQIDHPAHWRQRGLSAVDTRRHPEVGRALKAHWTDVGAARVRAAAPGQYSYVVFAASAQDLERIRELHLRYFHELRAIIAESTPAEHVAVANVQLFALDA